MSDLGCFFPFFPFFPIFAFFFSFPALGGILKISHCLGYHLCLALSIYFSNVIRGWILFSSLLCFGRQWYFGFVFCCLSFCSFWPYCKIPKSKSILEEFHNKLSFLAYSPQLSRNLKSGFPLFYGACRLPALSTESKVGWLGLNFRKVSRRRIDQTFAPLPSPFQTNWGIWGFDALNIFRWEVALIMTAAVVLVKLMRRNTSENKRKQIDQTLQ